MAGRTGVVIEDVTPHAECVDGVSAWQAVFHFVIAERFLFTFSYQADSLGPIRPWGADRIFHCVPDINAGSHKRGRLSG